MTAVLNSPPPPPLSLSPQTEYARFETGRFVYRINRSPMCDYMVSFIHRLKHLPEKYMMNSVLENFTILQVGTKRQSLTQCTINCENSLLKRFRIAWVMWSCALLTQCGTGSFVKELHKNLNIFDRILRSLLALLWCCKLFIRLIIAIVKMPCSAWQLSSRDSRVNLSYI